MAQIIERRLLGWRNNNSERMQKEVAAYLMYDRGMAAP
jgi:hypothetical protein